MANLSESLGKTLRYEGRYSNNPNDSGGETYCGISRKHWPAWEGWETIDVVKYESGQLNSDSLFAFLFPYVEKFYREHFWNRIKGNELPQELADQLFDCAVNTGVITTVLFLQDALNCLNRNGSLYPDIVSDGNFGTRTLKALKAYLTTDSVTLLCNTVAILRGYYYLSIVGSNSSQETFIRGWLKRLQWYNL